MSANETFVDDQPGLPPTDDKFVSGTGRALPGDGSNTPSAQSTDLVSVLVPLCIVMVISLLAVTAYKSWRYYRSRPPIIQKKQCSVQDLELGEEAPLREPLPRVSNTKIIDARVVDMLIIEEAEKQANSRVDNRSDECSPVTNDSSSEANDQPVPREIVSKPCVTFSVEEDKIIKTQVESSNTATDGQEAEALERPCTLKFLAASAAYQASTVPALNRLPYTPDPDCALSDSQETIPPPAPVEVESKDRVTPLTHAPRRMKPRGLLERRGSNVALTISLRPGEESNSNSSSDNSKSPKPLAYLQKASNLLTVEELHQKSCDTGALQKEFWSIPMNHPSEKNFNVPGHGTKNRHRILPNDHSRVKLPQKRGEDQLSSYINANYIRDSADLQPSNIPAINDEKDLVPVTRGDALFIATQGPLANTIEDFWRMIWLEEVFSIVMLTKLKERKEKCSQYFPFDANDVETYDGITVRVLNIKKHEHFTVRTMEISYNGETRPLCHFWYTTWMDHETPEKTRGLLEMVQEVSVWKKPEHGPIVVHCSAGIGRTGCYITVFIGCQQLQKIGKTDILKIVAQMRLDRGGMVQTWEQYQFVHQALSRYGRILAGENVTTPSTAGSVRSPREQSGKGGGKKEAVVEQPRSRTHKHRRSTSDTNLPSPKELRVNLQNVAPNSQLHERSQKSSERTRPGRQRTAEKLQLNVTALHTPQVIASLTPPKFTSIRSVSSPTIQSPFGRMCLQTKDLNAGESPSASSKFSWPSLPDTHIIDEKMTARENSESNKASPKKFKFSFTTLALSPTVAACGKTTPLSGNKNSGFSFDLPSNHKTILTNGFVDERISVQSYKDPTATPRSKVSANSSSPHSAASRSHFIFPSPSAR